MTVKIPVSKTRRTSLSNSPLANAQKLIHYTAAQVQEWIYFPDPMPLYMVLGVLAGNMMKGSPLWVMAVGCASGGKTVLLETLTDVPKTHMVSSIQGLGSLLSATSKKDIGKNATGGLLRQIGPRGMLVLKDFTSILSMPHHPMIQLIGALREIYDGKWSRSVGTDGGGSIGWRGSIGFLGACTPKIDSYHHVIQDLGQRWLYYRYEGTDGFGECKAALKQRDYDLMRDSLKELIANFIGLLDLTWDGVENRELTSDESNRLIAMASLMVAARSAVSRDRYTREIDEVVSVEAPPRMSAALGQLYKGLEVIGLEEDERWRIVGKVAMDSAPVLRMNMVRLLIKGSCEEKDMAGLRGLRVGKLTVGVTAGDLELLGIVDREKGKVVLSEWALKHLRVGWGL